MARELAKRVETVDCRKDDTRIIFRLPRDRRVERLHLAGPKLKVALIAAVAQPGYASYRPAQGAERTSGAPMKIINRVGGDRFRCAVDLHLVEQLAHRNWPAAKSGLRVRDGRESSHCNPPSAPRLRCSES